MSTAGSSRGSQAPRGSPSAELPARPSHAHGPRGTRPGAPLPRRLRARRLKPRGRRPQPQRPPGPRPGQTRRGRAWPIARMP
eukprot:485286-Alexandrium_andersonii.AAC.1